MRLCYVPKRFSQGTAETISLAVDIIEEYEGQGYTLTLRQLYYQFVSRDLIPNSLRAYKRLGQIVNDGRLAGEISWYSIEDRTRNLSALSHWTSPADIIRSAARGFRIDKWKGQTFRVEVWIEKEALAGVFQRVCEEEDVPFFSCRGYVSQSEMWSAAQRMAGYHEDGQTPLILHFGDHDPSGIDMTRDILERLELFEGFPEVERLALNMDQVTEFSPPPNPAKVTDSRFEGYLRRYGGESWELDALEPSVLSGLVRSRIHAARDPDLWEEKIEVERGHLSMLNKVSRSWAEVESFLAELGNE